MRIMKFLIPFTLVLTAGCATATPTAPQDLILSAKSTATTGSSDIPTITPSTASVDLPTITPSTSPKVILLIDDFEGDETVWTVCIDPECTDSSAIDVALTPDHATHGIHALQLNFEKTEKPKAVFYIEQPMDLSGGRTVSFDIYNPGTIDGVGFALTTGPDSVWHESDMVPVEQGKKVTLTFDLTAGNYKTAATNWEFRASIANLDNVVRLSIVIFPKEAGSVIVDYIILTDG